MSKYQSNKILDSTLDWLVKSTVNVNELLLASQMSIKNNLFKYRVGTWSQWEVSRQIDTVWVKQMYCNNINILLQWAIIFSCKEDLWIFPYENLVSTKWFLFVSFMEAGFETKSWVNKSVICFELVIYTSLSNHSQTLEKEKIKKNRLAAELPVSWKYSKYYLQVLIEAGATQKLNPQESFAVVIVLVINFSDQINDINVSLIACKLWLLKYCYLIRFLYDRYKSMHLLHICADSMQLVSFLFSKLDPSKLLDLDKLIKEERDATSS